VALTDLPDAAYLLRLYSQLRAKYFMEKGTPLLPGPEEVTIEWSGRLTSSAGVCYPRKQIIRLSTHYHRRYPQDIEATLLHEMIHLLVPGHGLQFCAWMERIRQMGGRVERYARERATARQPPRWRYECARCGVAWLRYRRLRGGGRQYTHRGCGGRLIEQALVD